MLKIFIYTIPIVLLTGFQCGKTSYYKTYSLEGCVEPSKLPENQPLTLEDVSEFRYPKDKYNEVSLETVDCKPIAFDLRNGFPNLEKWQCYKISFYEKKENENRTLKISQPFLIALLKQDQDKIKKAAIETVIFGGSKIEDSEKDFANIENVLKTTDAFKCWKPTGDSKKLDLKDFQ